MRQWKVERCEITEAGLRLTLRDDEGAVVRFRVVNVDGEWLHSGDPYPMLHRAKVRQMKRESDPPWAQPGLF